MASPYGIVEVNQTTAGTASTVGGAHARPANPRRPDDRQRALCPEGAPWRAPTASSKSTEQPPEPRSTVGGATHQKTNMLG